MIAPLILLATAVVPVSAEAWIETFAVEAMTIDGAPVDVATIGSTGSPKPLCIPKQDAKDVVRWLQNRDAKHCRFTAQTARKDRLVLEASCAFGTETANRKVIDLTIARHSYFGTYEESGRDFAGRAYRLTGRIKARRSGKCAA